MSANLEPGGGLRVKCAARADAVGPGAAQPSGHGSRRRPPTARKADPPDELDELRGVLLNDHKWRVAEQVD